MIKPSIQNCISDPMDKKHIIVQLIHSSQRSGFEIHTKIKFHVNL